MSSGHRLVRLPNGACSVHSEQYRETCHPVVGPAAEAELLYVRQLRLAERARTFSGPEFVVWDVGLGAGANALAAVRALRDAPVAVRVLSFDESLEPLRFAASQAEALGYFGEDIASVATLLRAQSVSIRPGVPVLNWEVRVGDFADLVRSAPLDAWPRPHAILFDPYSPKVNPSMWTAGLFTDLRRRVDASPCLLATYSRSTLLRVTLLLAGFFVGTGLASGAKEETTVAATSLALLERPLHASFLSRAQRSDSAEPLWEPVYRRAPLTPATWERLRQHPQFV